MERELEIFLEINDVLEEWKYIFRNNIVLKSCLINNIIQRRQSDCPDYVIPRENNVMRAFSRCPPQHVRVVIVGHDPVKYHDLASGFSFSFPYNPYRVDRNVTSNRDVTGRPTIGTSIERLHNVLVEAGFLESGGDYSYSHEEWADRGVLLLNASLTYEQFDMWSHFMKNLLLSVAHIQGDYPLFYLFWGTDAAAVGTWLSRELSDSHVSVQTIIKEDHRDEIEDVRVVIFIGDHPTFSLNPMVDMYHWQAVNQFKAIKSVYPALFCMLNLTNIDNGAMDMWNHHPSYQGTTLDASTHRVPQQFQSSTIRMSEEKSCLVQSLMLSVHAFIYCGKHHRPCLVFKKFRE